MAGEGTINHRVAHAVYTQGVRVMQRLFAIPDLCKRAIQSLTDFTIQFLAKNQNPELAFVRLTVSR